MKLIVLVKQTPDTAELPKVSADEVQSAAVNATMVINPWDEYAVEEAIDLAKRFGGEATALTLGPSDSLDALKHALAMGVNNAALIDSAGLEGGDMWTTAEALVAAVQAQGDVDIILAGKQSVDGNSGAVFVGVARKLGYPLLVNVSKIVNIDKGVITVERLVEGGQERVQVVLPVVISVAKEINDPRYPSFMGIRKANRAEIPVIGAAELGVSATAKTSWSNIRKPEQVAKDIVIIDGATVEEKAGKLADALLAEKVI